MPDQDVVNLPDLLGAVTDEERLVIDVVQCALALRPSTPAAGQPFEAILLMQNASDVNVDVTAQLKLPSRDAANKRNRFFAKTERLLVGLRPAEVGYLMLPVSSSPQTAVERGYVFEMQLKVKRVDKQKPQRVRLAQGGGFFVETTLDEETQEHIWQLNQLVFSAERAGRSGLSATFGIRPPSLAKVADFSPGWVSLWTMRDHVDERVLVDRVRVPLSELLEQFKRDTIFFPIMQSIQARFKEANYPLQAAEVVLISKVVTLMLESEAQSLLLSIAPGSDDLPNSYPGWLLRICRVLFDKPEASGSVVFLVQYVLDDLLADAIRLSFSMVKTVSGQDFGDESAQNQQVATFQQRLQDGEIGFTDVYLPLVLAGLIANTRIVMPNEKPRETISLLNKAREQRSGEMNESNQAVFSMTDNLIDRALDQTG